MEKTEISQEIENEILALKGTKNPEPSPFIKYIWVLSGFNSYLKTPSYIKSEDLADDYDRIELGISLAKRIATLRGSAVLEDLNEGLLKRFGPKIVYNGSVRQNNDLRSAIEQGEIDYPKENFIILPLPPHNTNTKEQFLSFKKELPLDHTSVGVITHAFHYPRISRMLNPKSPLYPFGPNTNLYVFLVDRQLESPGIQQHIDNEKSKVPNYILQGDLAEEPAKEVIYEKV